MDKETAFYQLWSSFSIPAYDENSVPKNADYPRIDYQVITDSFDSVVYPMAKLWYRSSSWEDIDQKKKEIAARLADLAPIPLDDGYMHVTAGTPFAQRTAAENDDTVKGYILNLAVEFFTRI